MVIGHLVEVVIVKPVDFYLYEGAVATWIHPGERVVFDPSTSEATYKGKTFELYPHEFQTIN